MEEGSISLLFLVSVVAACFRKQSKNTTVAFYHLVFSQKKHECAVKSSIQSSSTSHTHTPYVESPVESEFIG